MRYNALKVREKIRMLKILSACNRKAWKEEEKRIIEKRLKWIEKNKYKLHFLKGNDVEKAYRLFYLDYLGIKEEDIEILEKN
jgi:hypothetical protein